MAIPSLTSTGFSESMGWLLMPIAPLEGIQTGDIVEVDRVGRRFHALVTGDASGGLSIQPLDRRIGYTSCRARDVAVRWAKRRRPLVTSSSSRRRRLQLRLDTTVRG
jgi:hypothetical protein